MSRTQTRLVEFVDDDQKIAWCPFAAVALAGERMHTLNLSTLESHRDFAEILVDNEVACLRCFTPYVCEVVDVRFRAGVINVRCKSCGARFAWFATDTAWVAREEKTIWGKVRNPLHMFENMFMGNYLPEPVPERRQAKAFRKDAAKLHCPICREALLYPIRVRSLVRVVCRNAGCRQQWGLSPAELGAGRQDGFSDNPAPDAEPNPQAVTHG